MTDFDEFKYLMRNSPIRISIDNRDVVFMNERWYMLTDNKMQDESVKTFHEAMKWLVNPFWEKENKHPYTCFEIE